MLVKVNVLKDLVEFSRVYTEVHSTANRFSIAGVFCLRLQRISLDCTASERHDAFLTSSQAITSQAHYNMDSVSASRGPRNMPYASNILGRESIVQTVNAVSLSSVFDAQSFSSRPTMSHIDNSRQPPHSLASTAVSFSSAFSSMQFHGAPIRNTLPQSFLSTAYGSNIAGTVQLSRPPSFAVPSSSLFTNQLQSLSARSHSLTDETPVVVQRSTSRDHPLSAIDRLREKIGRGWLPPEPPYPPPPDDVPPSISPAESRTFAVSPLEQTKNTAGTLPVASTDKIPPQSASYAEPPLVDSTTEVTTTTSTADDDANQLDSETVTYVAKRPIEREDGEISDDEPDSVGTDLPPDSSGISSSNSHWNQRPPAFRGFRGGSVMMSYRPRFPYRGHFPRGRGFFRGRGFAPWRQWYDQPSTREWSASNDEHVVDSSGVRSPPIEALRKPSLSSRSPVHSPISSSDSEHDDRHRHGRSGHRSSKTDRQSRLKSKSKHDDHPVVDSTRTSMVASPEFEPSSDSDKEQVSHSSASKKKVCCFTFERYLDVVIAIQLA